MTLIGSYRPWWARHLDEPESEPSGKEARAHYVMVRSGSPATQTCAATAVTQSLTFSEAVRELRALAASGTDARQVRNARRMLVPLEAALAPALPKISAARVAPAPKEKAQMANDKSVLQKAEAGMRKAPKGEGPSSPFETAADKDGDLPSLEEAIAGLLKIASDPDHPDRANAKKLLDAFEKKDPEAFARLERLAACTDLSGHGAELSRRMGLTQPSGGVRREGSRLVLGHSNLGGRR